jgi:hypothetical protein
VIKRKGRIDPGDGPGEVLFHEMVHAMRRMLAKRTSETVREDLRMDDFEEFCSIPRRIDIVAQATRLEGWSRTNSRKALTTIFNSCCPA